MTTWFCPALTENFNVLVTSARLEYTDTEVILLSLILSSWIAFGSNEGGDSSWPMLVSGVNMVETAITGWDC